VNVSHRLLRTKRQGSRMSRVCEIRNGDSGSGVKMMKGWLVVESWLKSGFVDEVVVN
jgi:hypothetical protein